MSELLYNIKYILRNILYTKEEDETNFKTAIREHVKYENGDFHVYQIMFTPIVSYWEYQDDSPVIKDNILYVSIKLSNVIQDQLNQINYSFSIDDCIETSIGLDRIVFKIPSDKITLPLTITLPTIKKETFKYVGTTITINI